MHKLNDPNFQSQNLKQFTHSTEGILGKKNIHFKFNNKTFEKAGHCSPELLL